MTRRLRFAGDSIVLVTIPLSALVLGAGADPARGQCTANQSAKLTASDAAASDEFGISVSISGDVAVIGAPFHLEGGAATGTAYVYRFDGSTWIEQAKLTAYDGAGGDRFGFSVSISGDVVVVGAYYEDYGGTSSGSAYLFEKPPGGWAPMAQTAKLTASDAAADDVFAWSVSVSGDVAVIGAPYDDDGGTSSGSVYLFEKPPGGWTTATEDAKLSASDTAVGDAFGVSVCISGEVAVIGAPNDNDGGTYSGSAYLFEKPPGGWVTATEDAKLTASDAAADDVFGSSVSVSGGLAVIGAHGDDDGGLSSGSAYLFQEPPGGWTTMTEDAKFTASDAAAGDSFGSSVSISGELAISGARYDGDAGVNSGSAYLYAGLGDCNTNGTLDLCDVAGGTSQDCDGNNVPDECQPDADGDNMPDSCDGCPNDSAKTAPGQCGCSNPDTDTDGDGVADCVDNAPTVFNPDQTLPAGQGPPADEEDAAAGACGCGATSAVLMGFWVLCAVKLARRRRVRR